MMNDKISIVVPVYNLENYIEKTLTSICNQTYKNIEIIVVDDGSKDNSWKLVCECAKKDTRIVPIHQENGGVTAARLNGVQNATGDWIGFVDGDDEIDPDMYEFLLQNAHQYNADISHCGYRMAFADGRVNNFYNSGQIIEQDIEKGLKDLLDGSIVEPGLCNKLFSKNLFFQAKLSEVLDLSIKNNEDLLMNFLLFKESRKSIFIDECKYEYIVRQDSASRRINEHSIYDPIKVKQIICDIVQDELKDYADKAYIATCINVLNVVIVNSNSKEDIKKIVNLIKKNSLKTHLLGKKYQIMVKLILISPSLYGMIYKIYSRFFQKKKYS